MLNINMEDVVGVINACKPQLIVLAVVLVLAAAVIIAMAVNKKVKKADRFFIRWNAVLAFVLAGGHCQLGLSGTHGKSDQPHDGVGYGQR